MSNIIHAPWTEEQVATLNRYQISGIFHPYTCGNRDPETHAWYKEDFGVLIATTEGWICDSCDYTQDWAMAMMADTEVIDSAETTLRNLLNR